MDRTINVILFWSVLTAALCFNIDPAAWKSFSDSAGGFGYQVVQRQLSLLISAPLEQHSSNGRGVVFECTTEKCQELLLSEEKTPVNMSLGLAMASDPMTQNTLACGPTIPKDCKSITMYKGLCFEIDPQNRFGNSYPPSTEECQNMADIAFLLDASGSVAAEDFIKMKTFVKNLISSFLRRETEATKFSVTQFSSKTTIHYYFDTFPSGNWKYHIDNLKQIIGATATAAAIKKVVSDVFSPDRGSRLKVKKILIVITDGQSTDSDLDKAIQLADNKDIARFSVGVGEAFTSLDAIKELKLIASQPSENFMFQVENFEALEKIQGNLQDRIFSIEGSKVSGETLKLEMSQEGFRTAILPGEVQMSIVGANEWRGGYRKYSLQNAVLTGSFEPQSIGPDSYLGYSMAVAPTQSGMLTVLGAPRYKHRGVVITVFRDDFHQQINPYPEQSGEYFGAEVCAVDVNSDSYTDLILLSAPMYKDDDREGRVYVCKLTGLNVDCHFDSPSQLIILRGDPSPKGRFGSSLAALPDLNRDGFNDLVVGAPLENDGQGSIYIFNGEGGEGINPTYSQKMAASDVKSGLTFFGLSISPRSHDQSGDTLPDLAVGSVGTVVLLRSRPLVMVNATVLFSPNEIPTQNPDCSKPLESTAEICFTMRGLSGIDAAQAQIGYTLILDATRRAPNNRAYITKEKRDITGSVNVDIHGQMCKSEKFFIKPCPEDALNPIENKLKFTFDGLPSKTNLRPSLSQQVQTKTFHPIRFEISCGVDNECVDELNMDFNFTRSSEVKVGIDELLNVTVSVDNSGENSYNNHIILTYPVGLSYRKFTSLQGRIECNSLDSEDGVARGKTDCSVDKPIFKSNSKAIFIVSYGFNPRRSLDNKKKIFIAANATSGNQQHSASSNLYKKKEIGVKFSIFITIESSLSYNNFTIGKSNQQKTFQQLIEVTNSIRALTFTVVIRVPVKLRDKDIWMDMDSLQITDCERSKYEEPIVTDFAAQIKKTKVVDCSVARCRVFRCKRFMEKNEKRTHKISANLSSGWIEQIGLPSAKLLLTSTASLEYDANQYIFFSAASNYTPPVRKIEAEIEVFPEPDFTKEIIGGSLGGLLLLLLLTAGLYKAGFFKSKYNELMAEHVGEADPVNA
ncbi:integrin alpha-M isoform X1 [Nothobranchius furzeri]|uniref:Integrin alpha-M-like n=2 Tax=Nothobranchius furzeri TaxID=105023 RepID=A0A9D2XMX8_NOTFU|nr:integrin alpha-M-like [Nothobranchius furzeri]